MTTLLSLGIPGDAVTAILIGAFILHGIQPGPFMFEKNFDLVSAIFIGMVLINILFLVFGMFGAKYFARLLLVPRPILNTGILSLCVIGTYAIQSSMFDVGAMLTFGVLGYLMSKQEIPRAPMVLALILGPLMEENFRRWLGLAHGKYGQVLFQTYTKNPVSAILTVLVLLTLILPIFQKQKRITEDASTYIKSVSKTK
jgi:putative tricarboxylic transport membrane protein